MISPWFVCDFVFCFTSSLIFYSLTLYTGSMYMYNVNQSINLRLKLSVINFLNLFLVDISSESHLTDHVRYRWYSIAHTLFSRPWSLVYSLGIYCIVTQTFTFKSGHELECIFYAWVTARWRRLTTGIIVFNDYMHDIPVSLSLYTLCVTMHTVVHGPLYECRENCHKMTSSVTAHVCCYLKPEIQHLQLVYYDIGLPPTRV